MVSPTPLPSYTERFLPKKSLFMDRVISFRDFITATFEFHHHCQKKLLTNAIPKIRKILFQFHPCGYYFFVFVEVGSWFNPPSPSDAGVDEESAAEDSSSNEASVTNIPWSLSSNIVPQILWTATIKRRT